MVDKCLNHFIEKKSHECVLTQIFTSEFFPDSSNHRHHVYEVCKSGYFVLHLSCLQLALGCMHIFTYDSITCVSVLVVTENSDTLWSLKHSHLVGILVTFHLFILWTWCHIYLHINNLSFYLDYYLRVYCQNSKDMNAFIVSISDFHFALQRNRNKLQTGQ